MDDCKMNYFNNKGFCLETQKYTPCTLNLGAVPASAEEIQCYNTNITITADRPLAGLKTLVLNHCTITDIPNLSNLTSLNALSITSSNITDITNLKYLSAETLQSLYLNNNNITDISPLKDLTNLITLNLNDNKITDISPLSSLTSLTNLDVCNNPDPGKHQACPLPITSKCVTCE